MIAVTPERLKDKSQRTGSTSQFKDVVRCRMVLLEEFEDVLRPHHVIHVRHDGIVALGEEGVGRGGEGIGDFGLGRSDIGFGT